jgi:hypothetical protein
MSSDSSRQVSWSSAYWALVPIALNSMIQPGGRICGYDHSLRISLRISPLVCAFDAATIVIRFLAYRVHGYRTPLAAKMVKAAREAGVEEAKEGKRWSLENRSVVVYFIFAIGAVTQVIKLTACSGVLWTKVWCWSYFVNFLLVEAMNKLAEKAVEEQGPATVNLNDGTELHIEDRHSVRARLNAEEPESTTNEVDLGEQGSARVESHVEEGDPTGSDHDVEAQNVAGDDLPLQRQTDPWQFCERCWGALAVLIQLALLASVDLAVRPPDTDLKLRWTFRCVRLSAHFFVILIYLPFRIVLQSTKLTPRHLGYLIISFVVILFFAANTQGYRFSQQYFMYSLIISSFAWLLYFFDRTKLNVLFCKPGDGGLLNVLAFDFFCRTFGFSFFWYVKIYDPTGTFKPPWTDNLG